jgi:rRNA small subunit methyltransferase G
MLMLCSTAVPTWVAQCSIFIISAAVPGSGLNTSRLALHYQRFLGHCNSSQLSKLIKISSIILTLNLRPAPQLFTEQLCGGHKRVQPIELCSTVGPWAKVPFKRQQAAMQAFMFFLMLMLLLLGVSSFTGLALSQRTRLEALTLQLSSSTAVAAIEQLPRRELQASCKLHKLRATGTTEELRLRLNEYLQSNSSEHAGFINSSSSSSSSSDSADSIGLTHESPPDSPAAPAASAELTDAHNWVPSAALRKQFPQLTEEQWSQLAQLGVLLTEWNTAVNLISRKDISNVMSHHVLPCLGLAKALELPDGSELMDVGTGGGMPGQCCLFIQLVYRCFLMLVYRCVLLVLHNASKL